MPLNASDRPLLDPAVVARLGTLELKARTIVEGFLSGLHRSPFKGFSVEFAEYRQYIHGDDLSTIDWKVYARSDRYYVKKFEEETNLDCHLMIDVSGSMAYGSHHGVTKLEYGTCLAASIAYLMNRQRDAVGLTAFDERIVSMLPSSSRPGHLRSTGGGLVVPPTWRSRCISWPIRSPSAAWSSSSRISWTIRMR